MTREESKSYFRAESMGLGTKSLAAKAVGLSKTLANELWDPRDEQMVMTVSMFVVKLIRPQREGLAISTVKSSEVIYDVIIPS